MFSILRFIRFWAVPIASLIATFFIPVSNPRLWLVWAAAFISTCEFNCSSWAMARPGFWVGLHLIPIFLL